MECSIYFGNELSDLCCICLDECIYKKTSNENNYINFKCCNGSIHKRCLLMLFLNDFENCCLCRKELNIIDYYTIADIKKLLHINEIKIYKKELYTLIYKLSFNKMLYYIYIWMLNIQIFFHKIKNFMYICILDVKLAIKEIVTI